MDITAYMQSLGANARAASRVIASATTDVKNAALQAIHDALTADRELILAANAKDMANGQANHLEDSLLDRLALDDSRFNGMLEGLRQVIALPDPIGEMTDFTYRPSGIQLGKMRVPLGVIGIIYESRPNVTLEAASLCLKSGNATILRGGSEATNSNNAIAASISKGLVKAGMPATIIQVVEVTDRAAVGQLISMPEFVDVIVPRGGKGLIERISKDSRVPVIKHLDGNCHVFIDREADHDKAIKIAINAKTHRYGVCNAMETLLIDEPVAAALLPVLTEQYRAKGVELRGCERSRSLVGDLLVASEDDWYTEYLAPVLAIKVVDGVEAAIEHINQYGSHHT
ncbi:MAG: glutamate-5-semialdehyde dehydrogenase, partial [Moraxellaceae bacterium]|nr:glutamate-5-semialdehyde dehydrogenase [Moraxellaceae bacterium]